MKKTINTTPRGLFLLAAVLVGVFLVCHLLGLRKLTGILSGTIPATETELLGGLVYVLSWFSFVLVAPILTIAGLLRLALSQALSRLDRAREASMTQRKTEESTSLAPAR